MSYKVALDKAAEDFLSCTNAEYTNCERGLSEIDRIIVSVPLLLKEQTRSFMIPLLYAYWERFFKICFSEYFRALQNARIPIKEAPISLARYRVRRELRGLSKALGAGTAHEYCDKASVQELSDVYSQVSAWLNGYLDFGDPEKWVDTESNVRFKVLEKNCKIAGINVRQVESKMGRGALRQGLEDLVDSRNEIAHGASFTRISQEDWMQVRVFVGDVQNALQLALYESLKDETQCTAVQPPQLAPVLVSGIGTHWSAV